MVASSTVPGGRVPIKNTFVHFDAELAEQDASGTSRTIIKRTVSCPSVITAIEHAKPLEEPESPKSPCSTMTKTSFGEEEDSEDNSQGSTTADGTLPRSPQREWSSFSSWSSNSSSNSSSGQPGISFAVAFVHTVAASPAPRVAPAAPMIPTRRSDDTPSASEASSVELPPPKAQAQKKHRPMAMKKQINNALMQARDAKEVMKVVSRHLIQMNGVNLATAFHRLARGCEDGMDEIAAGHGCAVTFGKMLDMAQRSAEHELAHEDGTLPANCCTIIAWSCALLQSFRPRLFAALAGVATPRLHRCQVYEVTNLLWAFAEFFKHGPDAAKSLVSELQALLNSVAEIFMRRAQGELKIQVLTSALMSISSLPWSQSFAQTWLFSSTLHELASRWQELPSQSRAQVLVALDRLRSKDARFFENIAASVGQKCPDTAAAVFGGVSRVELPGRRI